MKVDDSDKSMEKNARTHTWRLSGSNWICSRCLLFQFQDHDRVVPYKSSYSCDEVVIMGVHCE